MSTRYLLLLFANILIAADPLGAAGVKISLDDALTEALTSGHGLQALNSTAEAAGHEARAAQRQRWGTLNAVASYRQLQDDVIIRPIDRKSVV